VTVPTPTLHNVNVLWSNVTFYDFADCIIHTGSDGMIQP